MKFKTRILLLPGATLAIFVVGWLASNAIAARTATTVAALGSVDYPYLERVTRLDELTKRTTQTVQSAVAEGDKSKLDDVTAIAADAGKTAKAMATLAGHEKSGAALGAAYDSYVKSATAAAGVMLANQGDTAAAVTAMQQSQQVLEGLLKHESTAARTAVRDRLAASSRGVRRAMTANTVSGAAIVLVLVLGAWMVLRAIGRDLGAGPERLREIVARIAAGDLRHLDAAHANPESVLGKLSSMTGQLGSIVGSIRQVSQSVSDASAQIAQGNDDLSRRSQDQAAALEETSASMQQMTTSVKNNAANAGNADQLARQARSLAEQGGQVVAEANGAMQDIDASSRRIADIVGLIDEIAFQTNLLALNAAVEAARAGEQGRGFAVVAGEVRSLAQRSANAAKEIKSLIADSVEKVNAGSTLVARSGQTLANIIDSVKKVTDSVAEIVAASDEQATGINEVSHTITAMDDTTQRNAALVEEVSATSRSMHEQAGALLEQVAFFTLADGAGAAEDADGSGADTASPSGQGTALALYAAASAAG